MFDMSKTLAIVGILTVGLGTCHAQEERGRRRGRDEEGEAGRRGGPMRGGGEMRFPEELQEFLEDFMPGRLEELARLRRTDMGQFRAMMGQIMRQKRELDELMSLDSLPIHPARLCKEINDFLDRDATIIADGGDASLMANRALRTYKPRHFLGLLPTGTLGIGTGYAMAARLARPDGQVLLFSGDGSFGLNAMEFDTMVRHNLPIVSVVCNDTAWGMMVRDQQKWGPDRIIGTKLGFVRYDKMVEALGGYGEMVEKPEEIKPALERAFASGAPACINVRVSGPLDE